MRFDRNTRPVIAVDVSTRWIRKSKAQRGGYVTGARRAVHRPLPKGRRPAMGGDLFRMGQSLYDQRSSCRGG
jgi:hypothetical protein